ncbi:CaiB/BaiF CoA-transferase family protein [Micromonospora sp. HUAS LYJ1]|uniref:CaiB/BaiF CoA transferase family protein n=1 Tax=Micromonospora sp. HUAS LYJ1 TaxID=3061626 RepID=UPI002670FADA|nr:CaiB/BaiF CoA-transferase family protein [Micromonospora sp. HUAS LYJ1]WKU03548.1 CaiB/BaiF CoA-transferase family protein [Micromonospora sp. HUAS LYJ1]
MSEHRRQGGRPRGGGPLLGLRVVEIAAMGPVPFSAMVLADLGADVLRVDRVTPASTTLDRDPRHDLLNRSRSSVALDLKHPEAVATLLDLVETADVVLEGFRPGVAERLGFGPDVCLGRNPRLVYGRMTGWGQEGPLAAEAGHDINYLAVSGLLSVLGRAGTPATPPANLLGDFGGGGMLLLVGVLSAVLSARSTGHGQVVDAAMVDGAALLGTFVRGFMADGSWTEARGTNVLDTGAPFYDVFVAADGGEVAIGALEGPFYASLLEVLGIDPAPLPPQRDRAGWTHLRKLIAERIATAPRDHWVERAAGRDACLSPVLGMREAPEHPHHLARGTFVDVNGVTHPAPAPRFSGTPTSAPTGPTPPGSHTYAGLTRWGVPDERVRELIDLGAARDVATTRTKE